MYGFMAFVVTVLMGFIGFWIGESFNFDLLGNYFSTATIGCFIIYAVKNHKK